MQMPVTILNTNTKRETGKKAQFANIAAAKAVSDIIRTTLGPRSMLKMLLDPNGGTLTTHNHSAPPIPTHCLSYHTYHHTQVGACITSHTFPIILQAL